MATMRTPKERMEIAKNCVRLEKEGGDILAYLCSENYLTPRATWYNIQREFLGRKRYEFTDGKPDERRKKKTMSKNLLLTPEVKAKAVQIAIDGGDPREYLAKEVGLKKPDSAWWKIRSEIKDDDPEVYEKLPVRLPNAGWKNNNAVFQKSAPKKPEKETPKKTGPDGKEYEKLELEAGKNYELNVAETPEKKRILDGVDMTKVTAPVNFGGYEVTAVRDAELGEFYFDRKYNTIDWQTPDGDEISMGPVGWRNLARQIPEVLGILGVKV